MTQNIVEKAILVLSNVPKGKVFVLRDLVPPIIWYNLELHIRANLGMKFYIWVINEGSHLVRPTDKTDEEQQRYIMI